MTAPSPTDRHLQRLNKLIWVLVFGGLLCLVLGLAVARLEAALGTALVIAGLAVAALGVVLIGVRARWTPEAQKTHKE